jgi:hypothetical protein
MKENKIYTTKTLLCALLEDMCKKTGKVSKDDFMEEALDILSEEFSDKESARTSILQHHLKQLIEKGDIKIEYENGEEVIYLIKRYNITLVKVISFKDLIALFTLLFSAFSFSIFWFIATKQYLPLIITSICMFASLIVLIKYERKIMIKS